MAGGKRFWSKVSVDLFVDQVIRTRSERTLLWFLLSTLLPAIVEFYFHDSNLPYDKFMWTLHSKTPEHWVPISTVASFKRMRALLSDKSGGVPWIAERIRAKSTALEVDEKG